MNIPNDSDIGAIMRHELAQGDRALAGIAPVLNHLLSSPGQSLVSDDIVASLRGMLADLSRQLLAMQAKIAGGKSQLEWDQGHDQLVQNLAGSTTVLSHCYALAIEGRIAGQLQMQAGIDPVLSPLMQELIASTDEATAELAMAAMSAQARFMQAHRRMHLLLNDLTAELFHETLQIWSKQARKDGPEVQFATEAKLRHNYDESVSRPGLLAKLVTGMKAGVRASFSLEHAGLALFASGVGSETRQPRELVVLSCHEQQIARFALTMVTLGLKPEEISRQLMILHGEVDLPEYFTKISADEARELLASTSANGAV